MTDSPPLLSSAEQEVLSHPEKWRWISSLAASQVRPISNPKLLQRHKALSHAPPQRELVIALSGKTASLHCDHIYPMTPGVVMMFDSREAHGFTSIKENRNFRQLWLHTRTGHSVTSNLNAVDANGSRTNTVLKFMSGPMAKRLNNLWTECAANPASPLSLAHLKAVIATAFYEAVSDWKEHDFSSPYEPVIKSICEHIQTHLEDDLSLETMANLAGYSSYFFHRIFLRYVEKPLHQYVVEARLERAKKLLQTGQTIQTVCDEIGMISPSYFSRFFKKHTGYAPSAWRDIHLVQK